MATRALLFDAIGTLLYAEPNIMEVYAAAARRHGSRYDDTAAIETRFRNAFRDVFIARPKAECPASHAEDHRRWQQVVAAVFDDLTDTAAIFRELWEHFGKPTAWRLFPDAEPAWREAERLGYLVGVASNYDDRILSVVDGHKLLADCEHLFHSAGVGYAKPDERFYRAVESRLGLSPNEITLVGDDWENDYLGALRAGWTPYYLDRLGLNNDGAFCFDNLIDIINMACHP